MEFIHSFARILVLRFELERRLAERLTKSQIRRFFGVKAKLAVDDHMRPCHASLGNQRQFPELPIFVDRELETLNPFQGVVRPKYNLRLIGAYFNDGFVGSVVSVEAAAIEFRVEMQAQG